ncbi:hypothetical protein [Streptomyces sp. MAR4 CNX-425]|uniref:hypothetical protein n=1 Tax=Streptomyces sp. MAR4 CNX-425 TaxID=3406343 RepID=UPI003B510652
MAERISYELTDAEAELLLELAKDAAGAAGELGGRIGGGAAGGGGSAGASGGRRGGRLGARMTKAQTAAATVDVPVGPDDARARARSAIARLGTGIEDPNGAGDGSLWGVIPSGVANMSPALLRVQVEPHGSGARVHLRASGREALIKQRIGAKAVDRVAAAIAAGQ